MLTLSFCRKIYRLKRYPDAFILNSHLLLFFICFSSFTPLSFGQCKLNFSSDKWGKVVYEENFDYNLTSEVSAEPYIGDIFVTDDDRPIPTGHTLYHWDMVTITPEGYLKLKIKHAPGDPRLTASVSDKEYLGGGIKTNVMFNDDPFDDDFMNDDATNCLYYDPTSANQVYKRGFFYGRFDLRFKFPENEPGFAPSFWLRGAREIDIFEYWGNPRDLTTAFHDRSLSSGFFEENGETKSNCLVRHAFDRDIDQAFRLMTCVWTPSQISFFLDGKELRTETRYDPWVCPLSLRMTVEINHSGSPVDSTDYLIDYVKVQKQSILDDVYMFRYEESIIAPPLTDAIYISEDAPLAVAIHPGIVATTKATEMGNELLVNTALSDNYWNSESITGIHVFGDLEIGEKGQVFFRGTNERLQTLYRAPNYQYGHIDDFWHTENYKVNSAPESIAIGANNSIFYRGIDNKMHSFYWDVSSQDWIHEWIQATSDPSAWDVAGDIVAGDNNWFFYRGQLGRLQAYYQSEGTWKHLYIDNNWNTTDYLVSPDCGALTVGSGNRIFYKGQKDNRIHGFIYDNSSSTPRWKHFLLPQELVVELAKGYVAAGVGDEVYYHGADDKMQRYFKVNGHWYHDWIDEANVTPNPSTDVGGEVVVRNFGLDNEIYYITANHQIKILKKEACQKDSATLNYPCYGDSEAGPGASGFDYSSRNAMLNEEKASGFSLYPNPANSLIFVETTLKNPLVEVFDISGKKCRHIDIQSVYCSDVHKLQMDISHLIPGVYIVTLRDAKGYKNIWSKKMIKM